MNYGHFLYKKVFYLLLIGLMSALLSNCSSTPKSTYRAHSPASHQKIIAVAKAQIGKPYRYGGKSPRTGFDCSGLINFSYKKAGLVIPRTTSQLYNSSSPIKRAHLQRGDLVFFRINRRKVSHVGLYLGNSKFVHAPSSGKRVNIANINDKYWRARFVRGGRI